MLKHNLKDFKKKRICQCFECADFLNGLEKELRETLEFLCAHQLETNMAKSFDWNIGYNHGLNKAIDNLKEVLGE